MAAGTRGPADTGVRLYARAGQTVRRSLIRRSDAAVIGSFIPLAPAAWLLPQRGWPLFCRSVGAMRCLLGDGPLRTVSAKAALALSEDAAGARGIAARLHAAKYELVMQIFRAYRPGGWRPLIEVHGRRHLDEALSDGRGAILWVGHFVFNSTVTKAGLHRLGYRVAHLSRPEHGFSKTRFGIAALNPVRCGAEDRFLDERIVLDRSRTSEAVRRLRSRLQANGIVSITIGPWEGLQLAEIPLLGGRLQVATGAVSLARQTGAPLLPAFAVREPGSEVFSLHLEPGLTVRAGAGKSEAVMAAVADYAARLEPYVRRYPDQWRGWGEWIPSGGSAA